jgi:hypothetical protein
MEKKLVSYRIRSLSVINKQQQQQIQSNNK